MLRFVKLKNLKFQSMKVFYCSVPVEHQPLKQEIKEFQYKFDREFSKDMLLNRFNLEHFEYPEIDNNHDCDRVQQLTKKLENLFNLLDFNNDSMNENNARARYSVITNHLSQSGLLGLCVPQLHHGSGYNCMMLTRVVEAINSWSISQDYARSILIPHVLATQALVLGGNESVHKHFLPGLSKGTLTAAVVMPMSTGYEGDIRMHTVSGATALLDSSDNSYRISGRFDSIGGLNGDRKGQSTPLDFLVVFAKTSENSLGAFIIDPRTDGVSVVTADTKHGCSISLEEVHVPAHNSLNTMPGIQLARKLSVLHSISVAASCSGLIRGLLEQVNEFVSTRLVFGKPLKQFQVIHYEISRLVGDAYAAESVSFYTSGLYDIYSGNDFHCEAYLAKIFALTALDRSIQRVYRLMGTAAVIKSDTNCALSHILENARLLVDNQSPVVSTKLAVLSETMEYMLQQLSAPMTFGERLSKLLIGANPKVVVKKQTIVDSFRYNLHQRVGGLADKLYPELYLCSRFLDDLARQRQGTQGGNLLREELVLDSLATVLSDVFSIIATLSRSSRAIAIGLHNQDTEVLVAELQVKWQVHELSQQLRGLREHYGIKDRFESLQHTAEHLREIGGSLQLQTDR